jgi:hypothetical protein
MDIRPCWMSNIGRFSPILWDVSSLVIISFAVQKLFSLMQCDLFIVSLRCWAFGVLFRNSFPIPICSSVFPTACWNYFKVSGFLLRSLIHFELILVQGERQGSNFSLLCMDIQFSQQHLLKRLSLFSIMWCMGLCLDLLFWSIGLPVWFCVNTFKLDYILYLYLSYFFLFHC